MYQGTDKVMGDRKKLLIVEDGLVYRVKRLTVVLRAAAESALQGTGVTGPQHLTLMALAANPGVSNATLARRSYVTPQTMNVIIQGLESAGLVERVEATDSRREIALRLTDEGRRRMTAGQKRIVEVEAAALAFLPAGERGAFLDHLDACSTSIETATAAPIRKRTRP